MRNAGGEGSRHPRLMVQTIAHQVLTSKMTFAWDYAHLKNKTKGSDWLSKISLKALIWPSLSDVAAFYQNSTAILNKIVTVWFIFPLPWWGGWSKQHSTHGSIVQSDAKHLSFCYIDISTCIERRFYAIASAFSAQKWRIKIPAYGINADLLTMCNNNHAGFVHSKC